MNNHVTMFFASLSWIILILFHPYSWRPTLLFLQDTGENIKENCYPHPIPRLVLWLHVQISPNISYAICNSIAALHWKYLSHTWHYKVLDHMNLIFFFLLLYSPCKSVLLAFMKSCSIRKLCHLDSRFWQTLTSMAHSEWCSLVKSFLHWFCAWS